jgi:phosphomannomutase
LDFVTALISRDLLSAEPGAVCFYDLRSSKVCEDIILESGGKPMMSRVGHSFIKDQMRANNAVFAGELSGHYYFRANYTAESSSMAVYALANIVSASDKPLSELVAPLRKYYQSGEINSRTSREPAEILEEIKTSFEGVEGVKIFELDGISIDAWDSEGWWANVRMSNTEPLVRLNLEGKNSKIMEEKRDEFLRKIRA